MNKRQYAKSAFASAIALSLAGAAIAADAPKKDISPSGAVVTKGSLPSASSDSAASPATGKLPAGALYRFSDRKRKDGYTKEQNALRTKLLAAKDRDQYRSVLEENGYVITAVNEDSPTGLEYEVVKQDHTFEVNMAFDSGVPTAKSVDVADNIWRAEETIRVMRDSSYRPPSGILYKKSEAMVSRDRNRIGSWLSEKERLEKVLLPGKGILHYQQKLKDEGYVVTSLNDAEPDYVELEIVKGDQSYELQMDRSASSSLVTKVDVTTNLWEAEETEKALMKSK